MKPLFVLFGLALAALLPSTVHSAAPPPLPIWPATTSLRVCLDRVALRQPLESVPEESVNLSGKIPAWLLARLELPLAQEQQRGRAVHDARLRRDKVVAVPVRCARNFAALVRALPDYMRPAAYRWNLTVFASPEPTASTPGGGYIHASSALVQAMLADRTRGEAALAFLLAREIGHVALGHCRAGWQRLVIEEQCSKSLTKPENNPIEVALWRTKARIVGQMVYFLYSRDQEYAADLFAMQLCRNAGIPVSTAIDGMRYLAAMRHPAALRDAAYRLPNAKGPPGLVYYLHGTADPLLRLKRLLQEQNGQVEPNAHFGLFVLNRRSGLLERLRPGTLAATDRPIVFVHGLHGDLNSWSEFLDDFAQRRELLSRPLVVLHHPANGSLARSGKFLANEVRALIPEGVQPTFICHSAGGLVFRYYAEHLSGRFDHAVLLGTPNDGSDLTNLKFLVDLLEFAGMLRNGLPAAIALAVANGRGEIGRDLHPDSLFLRDLGRKAALTARYRIVYGEIFDRLSAVGVQVAFGVAVRLAEKRLIPVVPEGFLRDQAQRLFDRIHLPSEILRGDGVVRSRSAILPGVADPVRVRLSHLQLLSDLEVIRVVLGWVLRGA